MGLLAVPPPPPDAPPPLELLLVVFSPSLELILKPWQYFGRRHKTNVVWSSTNFKIAHRRKCLMQQQEAASSPNRCLVGSG